ncbi:MAG TPA: hypothetical protein H9924_10665 [Candidatus Phocaeicola merdavium]|nr:hypothetical protein [Candidatus Phocaeicola merdavium]
MAYEAGFDSWCIRMRWLMQPYAFLSVAKCRIGRKHIKARGILSFMPRIPLW